MILGSSRFLAHVYSEELEEEEPREYMAALSSSDNDDDDDVLIEYVPGAAAADSTSVEENQHLVDHRRSCSHMQDHCDMGGDIRSSVVVVVAEEGGDKQQQQLVVAADLHYAEKVSRLLDMGFTTDLIQRALLIYGTQAAESVLVQFLLDCHENHHHHHQQQQQSGEGNSHGDSFVAGLEVEVAGHSIIAACTHDEDKDTKNYWLSKHSLKSCQNEQRWEIDASNEDKEEEEDDYDDHDESDREEEDDDHDEEEEGEEENPPCRLSWVLVEAATNSVISTVTPLCPTPNTARLDPKEQHNRNLLLTQGFTTGQVEQALQELGGGAEYDMLLDYTLYLMSEQDGLASTSGHITCQRRINTVEKLVTEFKFSTHAVKMALERCDTPEWNADEEQIADLVDFLAAHGEALEEDLEMDSGTKPQWMEESADWSRLREQVANNVAAKRHGKRKIGEVNLESSISSSTRLRRCTTLKQPLQMPKPDDAPPCRGVRRLPHTVRTDEVCGGGGGSRIKPPLERSVARASKRIEKLQIPRRSEGFGLPGEPVKHRYLSDEIKGAPFFYFENVASMPNEDWNRIKLHLFDIEPEYVDSLHFSACRRPRGYIHNLPIEGRKKILPDPPMTIQELMPQTKFFWPAWDPRTKLNCINTRKGSEFLSKKLQLDLRSCLETADPSPAMQQEILKWCREWNLVWTAPNIPTPIAENEMEAMLGFDKDHTRNCYSTRARYKALGNSFSVFTVAFHFSVLKPLYPRGMKILSLFSGIGGAEIALHKIGVKLQVVVSVEIIEGSRRCLEAWWAATKQTGTLDQNHHDVTALGRDELVDLVKRYKGFDLIVGGSPCNNLSGNNQKTRCGIEGPQSNIFFEFSRIVGTVRELMQGLQFSSP